MPPAKNARDRYAQFPVSAHDHVLRLGLIRMDRRIGAKDSHILIYSGKEQKAVADLGFMLVAHHLTVPFSDAFAHWASLNDKSTETIRAVAEGLQYGFFRYIVSTGKSEMGWRQNWVKEINLFEHWLDNFVPASAPVLSDWTKDRYRKAIIKILKILSTLDDYKSDFESGLSFKISPWSRSKQHSGPTKILTRGERDKLFLHCVGEVLSIQKRVREDWEYIKSSKDFELQNSHQARQLPDRVSLVAELSRRYPSRIPGLKEIGNTASELARSIDELYRSAGITFTDLVFSFQPHLIDLIPFILLLGMYTGFNTGVLLELKISNIRHLDLLGQRRLRVQGYKARGRSDQSKSFPVDCLDHEPPAFIDFLTQWTARIRTEATLEQQDFLFLYAGTPGCKVIGHDLSTWRDGVANYLAKHNLKKVSISQIRQTYLELIREIYGDDPFIVQHAAGHKNVQTSVSHYTSDAMRKRNDERIGQGLEVRERWLNTAGQIDPRHRDAEGQDLAAATLGFTCLDPNTSPIPGQTQGRLCDAYGACPICPHALVDAHSPYAYARLLQLRASIIAAQTTIPAQSWLTLWSPRLERLDSVWLPGFVDQDVLQAAVRLHLSPLPPLEMT